MSATTVCDHCTSEQVSTGAVTYSLTLTCHELPRSGPTMDIFVERELPKRLDFCGVHCLTAYLERRAALIAEKRQEDELRRRRMGYISLGESGFWKYPTDG